MHTYHRYRKGVPELGSLIIKLYHSGDEIRGFIRKAADTAEDDTIFPGEEMDPETALRMAENKNREPDRHPIFIELSEGVEWNPAWGRLA